MIEKISLVQEQYEEIYANEDQDFEVSLKKKRN
jgi:hypothetical protein